MALEGSLLRGVLGSSRGPQPLPASIALLRHGAKQSAAGDLSPTGWRAAERQGIQIGADASDSGVHSIRVLSGTADRVMHTAEAATTGMVHANIQRRGNASSPEIVLEEPTRNLSLSAIVTGPESVFVQRYLARIEGARDGMRGAFDALPRPISMLLHVMRYSQLEAAQQEAAGQLLLEWLRLDGKRMTLPSGEPDPHTRSAREIGREQANLLKKQLDGAIASIRDGKPTGQVNFTHENFVLIWARYFLYQKVRPRRGQPERTLRGMQIVEKVGGKIPYLDGVYIKFEKQQNGDIVPYAWFNHARYELDMEAIDALSQETNTIPRQTLVKKRFAR